MALTDIDKAKVRTAVKCYLKINGRATAKQLNEFIQSLDLKLHCRLNPQILALELKYCMSSPNKNFLNISFEKDVKNRRVYYLVKK